MMKKRILFVVCMALGAGVFWPFLSAPAAATPMQIEDAAPVQNALAEDPGLNERAPENPLPSSSAQPRNFSLTEYTVGSLDTACGLGVDPSGIVTVTDVGGGLLDLAIDFTNVPTVSDAVFIPTDIAWNCRNTIHAIVFTGAPHITKLSIGTDAFAQNAFGNALVSVKFPEGIRELDLGETSFYQYAAGFDNTLTDVVFPSTLKDLHVGKGAFSQGRQNLSNGDNSLETITFPDGLVNLKIDEWAFYQIGGERQTDTNTLKHINFPTSLRSLDIGYRAFSQWSNGGGPNALERVDFPEGLEQLRIGEEAFYQSKYDQNKLHRVTFPSTLKRLAIGWASFYSPRLPVLLEFRAGETFGEGPGSLVLDQWVVAGNGGLFWYGKPDRIKNVWGDRLAPGSADYEIAGDRQLDLALHGGQIAEMNGSASRFAYPAGEGNTISFGGLPAYTGVSPKWPPYGIYRVILPIPTKTGHTFLGWCDVEPVNEACPSVAGVASTVRKPGDEYILEDNGDVIPVVHAMWKPNPKSALVAPVAPYLAEVACDVEPTMVIPTVEGVQYTQTRDRDVIKVIAEPRSGYIFASGTLTEWQFKVTTKACSKPPASKPPSATPTAKPTTENTESSLPVTGSGSWPLTVPISMTIAGCLALLGTGIFRRRGQRA